MLSRPAVTCPQCVSGNHQVCDRQFQPGFSHWGSFAEYVAIDYADVNLVLESVPEFAMMLSAKTLVYPFLYRMNLINMHWDKWRRIEYQFDAIADVPTMFTEPTFTFAHLLLPHPPFVFNSDGTFLTPDQAMGRTMSESYIAQVEYANRKILTLVDELLANSKTPPVIIVQSDEGPYPEIGRIKGVDWRTASDEELSQKIRILNAMYIPGATRSDYSELATPVNTFRTVFNTVFGADMEMVRRPGER